MIIIGLVLMSINGHAKTSKSVGIQLGVDKGSLESLSVSTQTQSSDTAAPQSTPQSPSAPANQPAPSASNQALQQQYLDLFMQVQQLMMQINQQQLQLNQQQTQIDQLAVSASSASPQPTTPAKVHTCYINESRNTFIGEGNTQVAAKAKTLSQCKSANGWCKPDTLVCD
jgi:TolA-binding protein